jgi:PAS domain S-box-containing protein
MRTSKSSPPSRGNLRHRAEERLIERKRAANLPLRDPERIVHELEVHQMELEIQNEELRESRIELETALARYTEIFDFAPIGYVAITLDGTIREINHVAARLLGAARAHFTGANFNKLVTPRSRAPFAEMLRLVLVNDERESCELEVLHLGGRLRRVWLMAALLARAEPLILLTLQDPAGMSLAPTTGIEPDAQPDSPNARRN